MAPGESGELDLAAVTDGGGRVALAAAPARQAAERAAFARSPGQTAARPPLAGGSRAMTGWSNNTADLMLASTLGFVRPRMSGGVVDRMNLLVNGSDGRAEAMMGTPVTPSRQAGAGRWSATAWMLWRPETAPSAIQAPLLGGSQAGARLDYRLTSGRNGTLSLYGRVSRAFTGPSAEEGALGLAWGLGRLPVSLLAERRQRLGPGGRSGFALLAAGGMGPRDIAPRLEAEGYVQAGIVGLPGADAFADGKASLGYRLSPAGKRGSVTFGASVSGSVQPGAERLDVGPELRLRLPVGPAGLRLSTEWRARIAGDARPRSGPAITLVADF